MATNAYFRKARTGGTVDDLDGINGSALVGGEMSFVYESGSPGTMFFYVLNATSAAEEDGLDVIAPDSNPGDKRWILQRMYSETNIIVSATEPPSPVIGHLWVDIG